MTEKTLHELEIESRTHSVQILQIVDRMDSYHQDSKTRFDSLPTTNEIKLMLSEFKAEYVGEIRRLADGVGTRMTKLETNEKWSTRQAVALWGGITFIAAKIWGIV